MFSCFFTDLFEVNVDTIHAARSSSLYQPFNQTGPLGCGRQHRIRIYFFIKIIHQPPDFQPHLMGLRHIIHRCNTGKIPFIVTQGKPCGRNGIQALHTAHDIRQIGIGRLCRHLMPRHADLLVSRYVCIDRLFICRHRLHTLRMHIAQTLFLHITDHGIGFYFDPVFHLLQNHHLASFGNIFQDFTFNTTLVTDLRVLADFRKRLLTPLGIHL